MLRAATAPAFALAILLSACASKPGSGSASTSPTTEQAAAIRIAPAVPIPAVAAKRLVLTMTGPETVVQSKDWSEFKREWRETFAEHAKEAGVAYAFAEQAPGHSSEEGTLATVHVADYRIVGIGTRIMFGIMTGNAYIDARIRFTALRDGTVYGEQQYNTTSSAGAGVFAKVTPQQVDAIAANIFLDLKPTKP